MWRRRPDSELVESWIDRALELADPESAARAEALTALCFWKRADLDAASREASAIADRLGDVELRSRAWGARGMVPFAAGDYEESLAWAQRRLEVVDEISDPDHIADIYEDAIPSYLGTGRLHDARHLAVEHNEVVDPLSAHHRVHGVSVLLETEEAVGGWDTILGLAPRTEAAIDANLATPCVRNARSLLVTALAAAYLDDQAMSSRLEEQANELVMEAHEFVLAAPRVRLAILRGRLDEVERLVPELENSVM